MENEVQKKRILSGIQPSGDLTLGSYLGAIRNWAALADEYDCYYMLADMHTITVRQVPADLRRHTLTQVAAYIASGLDPEKNVLFVQSHVPAHAQLDAVPANRETTAHKRLSVRGRRERRQERCSS